MTPSTEQSIKTFFAAALAATQTCLLPVSAEASVVFNLEKDTVTLKDDGITSVSVRIAECRAEAHALWFDPTVAHPFKVKEKDLSYTYMMEDTDIGPNLRRIVGQLNKWKSLSISEKVKAATPASRDALGVELREPCPSAPASQSTSAPSTYVDADGCTDGRSMVYVPQRTGFLGLGGKKQVPIGCMTREEVNRWNIEQQNQRPQYVPPAPTYQPRNCISNVIGSQVFTNCY